MILMDEEDAEKMTFITPWGVYHYRVMLFGLKNAGATYMRAMTTIFHDMIQKEIEIYVDDVIIKSRESSDHLSHLEKFFERLRKYNLKLNPAKCAFGVSAEKLLGFVVSRRGIKLDPLKIKEIQELPPPKTKKEVMSFLGRLNYISRFIAQSMLGFGNLTTLSSRPRNKVREIRNGLRVIREIKEANIQGRPEEAEMKK